MKKILSILCITIIFGIMSITAFAVDDTTNSSKQSNSLKTAESIQKRADLLDKKLQFLKFKQSFDEKTAAIRESRTLNRDQLIENTVLRKDILTLLKTIKENGSTLSPEVQDQLKAYNLQIKEITSSIKETKGDIKDILAVNKENIKNMNYEAVDSAFSQVASIQKGRNEQLAKINEILKNMKSLLSNPV